MDSITLQNYRCFREGQTARLAPLTLLVGENSTGKTSFLALIRALWDVAFREVVPDFREEPYNLGVFGDIAHHRGRRGGRATSFEAGFEYRNLRRRGTTVTEKVAFHASFKERNGSPFPTIRTLSDGETRLEAHVEEGGQHVLRFYRPGTENPFTTEASRLFQDDTGLVPLRRFTWETALQDRETHAVERRATQDSVQDENLLKDDDLDQINRLLSLLRSAPTRTRGQGRPIATAPVRSRPRRTYDPTQPSRDAEGEYVPTYFAREFHRDQASWKQLKGSLEQFGLDSGLFDEITVNPLGRIEGTPFQLEVRKFGKRTKGPQRNLIDVGYGVSQALPILTELLRSDAPAMFLLQQPEVHLHPMAQAALGSLFCSLAGPRRQLVVETHSDYILDRVRMDIRDKRSRLKPDDVSILFFEPGDLDVNIHSIRLDAMGNVLDAPPGYGQFFMEEVRRSVGMSIRT